MTRTPDGARQIAKEFGQLLQKVRRKHMDQAAFAHQMGVSRTTISNIERGAQRVFLDQVYRAAAILGITVNELIPRGPSPAKSTVHAAADDPLPRVSERRLEEVVRETRAKYDPSERGA